jgi:hypothetical protein
MVTHTIFRIPPQVNSALPQDQFGHPADWIDHAPQTTGCHLGHAIEPIPLELGGGKAKADPA